MDRGVQAPSTGIEAHCASGNCTFPETWGTVAYCNCCEDSTKELIVTTRCFPDNTNSRIVSVPVDCPDNSTFIMESSLPDGHYLTGFGLDSMKMNVTYKVGEGVKHEGWSVDTSGTELFKMDVNMGYDQPDIFTTVVQLIFGKTPLSGDHLDKPTGLKLDDCDGPDTANDWRCRGYEVATCFRSPSVKIYNSSVVNGQLSKKVISSSGSLLWGQGRTADSHYMGGEDNMNLLDTDCITEDERNRLKAMGYHIDLAQRWLPFNSSFNTNVGDVVDSGIEGVADGTLATTVLWKRKCLCSVASSFAFQVGVWELERRLVGSVRGVGGSEVDNGGVVPGYYLGDVLPKALYNTGRIDFKHVKDTFANISESLTKYMRTYGNKTYAAKVFGQVERNTTCLEVQWLWVIFPAALALLTVMLLVLVIAMSITHREPVWKASPLVWIHRSSSQGGGLLPGDGTGTPALAELEKKSKVVPVSVS